MASLPVPRNVIFNFTKSFPTRNSSPLFPSSPIKISRISFTYAPKHPQGRNAPEESKQSAYEAADKAKESMSNAGEGAKETAKEGAEESKQSAYEAAQKAKESMSNAGERAKETAKEGAERMKEGAYETKDKARERAHETKEKAKEGAGKVDERTRGAAGYAAEKTEEGAGKATETVVDVGQTIGEKAKQTVQGAWGAAKGTTQKIKETVVGKSDEEDADDYIEDHVRKPSSAQGQHEKKKE